MRFVRIEAPHFTAGVIVGIAAAPIVGYMRTWTIGKIVRYCTRKGWRVMEVGAVCEFG
jgi:hypothetical protein